MTPDRKFVIAIRDALDTHESELGARAQLECLVTALQEQANHYEKIGNYTRTAWMDAGAEWLSDCLDNALQGGR